ncbi:beta strand repeat-containing protein [Sphingosinithalassobacter portus]|uniref:beta strand repeat-containing protein n=1 Tax=Stakelama portus TaxID=2676234 RepID=UPI000D6E3567|nr:hypothetical protein [Sphingosinithalassobacter portus]
MKIVTAGETEIEIGTLEASPTIGIVDYSRRVTDDFGVTTIVKRGFSRKMSVRVALETENVAAVQRQLAALRATSARWKADDRFDWLNFEGYYKDFELDLAVPPLSYCTLNVEGLAETEAGADPGGDPAPTGTSTLRLLQPMTVTDAALVSCSIAENDASQWSAATTYAAGAKVLRGNAHRIYESVADGNVNNDPATSTGKWIDVGPTNRWAMLDGASGTASSSSSTISITIDPSSIDAVALIDVVGTSARVQAPGYDRTIAVANGSALFLDLPTTTGNVTVTVSGSGTKSIGTLLIGTLVPLGVTEASPTAGILDFSRKETDDFGEVTLVQRAWAKRMAARALIRTDAIDMVANRVASVRAQPALWIGDSYLDSLIVHGFFRDFTIEVGETVSTLALNVEGFSDATTPKSLGQATTYDDGTPIEDLKPAEPGATPGAIVGENSDLPGNVQRPGGGWYWKGDLETAIGTAAGVLGQGALATENAVLWGGPLIASIPTELTDGRIAAGLDGSGDLARNISTARANSSALLRKLGGGLFTGELAADVTAGHTAAAITGQGGLATKSVVTPSLLSSGFGSAVNAILDPTFQDSSYWESLSVSTNSAACTALGVKRAAVISGDGGTSTSPSYTTIRSRTRPCRGGELLTFGARSYVGVQLSGKAYVRIDYFRDDDSVVIAAFPELVPSGTAAGALGSKQARVKLPDDAVAWYMYLYVAWDANVARAGTVYFADPFVSPSAVLGQNVVLEDGTTAGTEAVLRTSLGTAAAISGQGSLATKSVVSLDSDVTDGATYKRYQLTERTKLTGVENYATVGGAFGVNLLESTGGSPATLSNFKTVLGTAAAITGQGGLATKSAVDLSSGEVTNKSLANLDSTASTKLGGIAAGATVGAAWGTNLTGRPTELTDGRVAAGLDSSGLIAQDIPQSRATSSNLLRKTGGGLFVGDLDADLTGANTAAAILNQGSLATKSAVNLATSDVTGTLGTANAATGLKNSSITIGSNGSLSGAGGGQVTYGGLGGKAVGLKDTLYFGDGLLLESSGGSSATLSNFKTSLGIASAITGQGGLATKSAVDLSSSDVTNKSLANVDSAANTKLSGIAAGATVGAAWGTNLTGRPAELTDGRVSAGLTGDGDLNRNISATRRDSSNLLGRSGGGLFTGELAADVTAGHTAAAITGQGGLATKSVVTPSLLSSGFGSAVNAILDPTFQDSSYWESLSVSTNSAACTALGVKRAAVISGDGGTSTSPSYTTIRSRTRPCRGGELLTFGARSYVGVQLSGKAYVRIDYFRDDDSVVIAAFPELVPSGTAAGALGSKQARVKLPDDAVAWYMYLYVAWDANVARAGTVYFADPFVSPSAVLGQNVVLEDGTTAGTEAVLRTSLGTAAAISGQGTGATANSLSQLNATEGTKLSGIATGATVGAAWGTNLTGRPTELTDGRVAAGLDAAGDLARNLTTTRANSSNLLRRTSGGLFTGELAADVTSGHTAAAIAGQGALATQSAVDLSSGQVTNKSLANLDSSAATKLSGIEADADVTANNQHGMADVPNIVVNADYTGTANSGELPKLRSFRRLIGTTDVSESTSYAILSSSGCTATINNTAASAQRGDVSVSAVSAAQGSITVSAAYGGVTLYKQISIQRIDAPPPVSAASGPASTSSFTNPGTNTTHQVMTENLTVVVGTGGEVDLTAPLTYSAVNGSEFDVTYLAAKWQYSADGSTGWSDVASEITGSAAERWFSLNPPKGQRDFPGDIAVTQTKTGLTNGATAYFRLMGRMVSGGQGLASVVGTATASPQ